MTTEITRAQSYCDRANLALVWYYIDPDSPIARARQYRTLYVCEKSVYQQKCRTYPNDVGMIVPTQNFY